MDGAEEDHETINVNTHTQIRDSCPITYIIYVAAALHIHTYFEKSI